MQVLESTSSTSHNHSNPKRTLKIGPGGITTTCQIMRSLNNPIPEVTQIVFRIALQKLLSAFRLAHLKLLNAVLAEIIDNGILLNH